MAGNIELLRTAVREYDAVDRQLEDLNAQVSALRKQRSIAEGQLAILLQEPEFATVNKMDFPLIHSSIKIKRPGTWNTGWSLGKGALYRHLQTYFAMPGEHTAEQCQSFIDGRVQADSVGRGIKIERSNIE